MVESRPLREPYGVLFRAREHEGFADTIKSGLGGDAGMRPHELLEAALASCITITARMTADELAIPADGIHVVVELERTEQASVFRYQLQLPTGLTQAQIEAVNSCVESSPVRLTLLADLRFEAEPSTATQRDDVGNT